MTIPTMTQTTSPKTGLGADNDAARRTALRRMQAVALGLLLFAAVVYVLTHGQDGWLGFVNAGAEASMVGAIADWFAVTALFRHPLGLPIPHTALIPRRKDDLGKGLEEFVGENFMAEDIVRERVLAAEPTRRIGAWAAHEENARKVVEEVTEIAAAALGRVREEHIVEVVESVLVPRFREEPISPILGTFVTEAVRDDLHHGLVDLALEELHGWLTENHDTFTEVLGERAPTWVPLRVNEVVTTRIHAEALRWMADIRSDPNHRARHALDSMLRQLGQDLLFNDSTQERAENLKLRLLDHPQFAATGISLWKALRNALLAALQDDAGPLKKRLTDELVTVARRFRDDPAMQRRLDDLAADAVVFGVNRYGAELTTVITTTIERWDGKEAAERIELHVGRDLQFIRINGTIVGGLVGVLIHTVSVLLP
ncbi:uncharacterized membrane-anchored protein YjiN (DUF445 family) [Nocardioides daedukensis]|uniref:Uncharacterized membrane-anchored protein YjiN (DUF445 family) n=1 Tax=Nocardioides daedukensis TaxID=634462 RepID=A0A7Y9S1E0_9ACTN|nr:DUF445 domain-containing protein [Nocardioides daedukensis]NYG60532.1 uncharacterized membrane-anchored protein YjiN (DUF445 family) [Nocardioides daedukensis]